MIGKEYYAYWEPQWKQRLSEVRVTMVRAGLSLPIRMCFNNEGD